MKTLVIFYSLEGSTKAVAQDLARELGGDLFELKTVKPYPNKGFAKYFWGGKSATFGESPKLQSVNTDLARYDKIVFGTPIWAGTFAPPLRTFIKANSNSIKNKKIAFFACSMSSAPDKAFSRLKKLLPENDFIATERFTGPVALKESDLNKKIKAFAEKISGRTQ